MKEYDYYIKDEGDFFTLCLCSDKAKEIFKKSFDTKSISLDFYGDQILKLDIHNDLENEIIKWGVSHNLKSIKI